MTVVSVHNWTQIQLGKVLSLLKRFCRPIKMYQDSSIRFRGIFDWGNFRKSKKRSHETIIMHFKTCLCIEEWECIPSGSDRLKLTSLIIWQSRWPPPPLSMTQKSFHDMAVMHNIPCSTSITNIFKPCGILLGHLYPHVSAWYEQFLTAIIDVTFSLFQS